MPVTIHDVAKKAGVGIGTVSSVLNNSRRVSDGTRKRVLDAVVELDFVPNPSGRRLSMGKTHTIGVIIPYFTIPAQIQRLRGVMSVIADSDYDISLFAIETPAQRDKALQTVPHRGRIDGLLIFSLNPTPDDIRRILRHHIPAVMVEDRHPMLHSIFLDNVRAAQMAVNHLIDLGHKKIAYISELLDNQMGRYSQDRYRGYRQALEVANITPRPDYFHQCWVSVDAGYKAARQLLSLSSPPTAIFTYSDVHALGALEAAREMGFNIPADLSIMGYDNIETARFAQLTTIRQHLFDSGLEGINLLLKAIETPDMPPTHIELTPELIVRGTTGPPGQLAINN